MTKHESKLLAAKVALERAEWDALAARAELAGMRTADVRAIRHEMTFCELLERDLDEIARLRGVTAIIVDAHEQAAKRGAA